MYSGLVEERVNSTDLRRSLWIILLNVREERLTVVGVIDVSPNREFFFFFRRCGFIKEWRTKRRLTPLLVLTRRWSLLKLH